MHNSISDKGSQGTCGQPYKTGQGYEEKSVCKCRWRPVSGENLQGQELIGTQSDKQYGDSGHQTQSTGVRGECFDSVQNLPTK